jgi:hypothetical protein
LLKRDHSADPPGQEGTALMNKKTLLLVLAAVIAIGMSGTVFFCSAYAEQKGHIPSSPEENSAVEENVIYVHGFGPIHKLDYLIRYGEGDLVILGVAAPDYGQEQSREGIAAFLEENGYTYPTVMMENQSLYYNYGISAFPTTYMIDKNGMIYGYVTGALSMDIMREIIELTRTGETED